MQLPPLCFHYCLFVGFVLSVVRIWLVTGYHTTFKELFREYTHEVWEAGVVLCVVTFAVSLLMPFTAVRPAPAALHKL